MRLALRKNVRSGRAPRGRRLAVLLLVFQTLVWLSPTAQHAQSNTSTAARREATLADYRARVRDAIEPLEELAELYERVAVVGEYGDESGRDSEAELDEAEADLREQSPEILGAVRDALPPRERVGRGADFIEVDNAWLHDALDEAEGADEYEKCAAGLRAAAGRLRSLEARLAEAEGAAAGTFDRDAERGRLNAILSAPEFDREARRQQQQGNALQKLVKDFIEWVLSLLPKGRAVTPGASPRVSMTTQIVVLALCLAVLAYVARLLWLRRGRGKSRERGRGARVVLGERLGADQTASDLLDDAERLALAGDLRGAIRKAYVALLCELGDRGVVRLAQHKTNRDYLSAVRRAASPGLYAEMLPLTFDFEVHWYGLRDATASDWESFKTRCRKALGSQ